LIAEKRVTRLTFFAPVRAILPASTAVLFLHVIIGPGGAMIQGKNGKKT
jgi:hypothetical protein